MLIQPYVRINTVQAIVVLYLNETFAARFGIHTSVMCYIVCYGRNCIKWE